MHLQMAKCRVPFWVTVILALTSDLVFRIIVSGAYSLYNLRKESQFLGVDTPWDDKVSHIIFGSV